MAAAGLELKIYAVSRAGWPVFGGDVLGTPDVSPLQWPVISWRWGCGRQRPVAEGRWRPLQRGPPGNGTSHGVGARLPAELVPRRWPHNTKYISCAAPAPAPFAPLLPRSRVPPPLPRVLAGPLGPVAPLARSVGCLLPWPCCSQTGQRISVCCWGGGTRERRLVGPPPSVTRSLWWGGPGGGGVWRGHRQDFSERMMRLSDSSDARRAYSLLLRLKWPGSPRPTAAPRRWPPPIWLGVPSQPS